MSEDGSQTPTSMVGSSKLLLDEAPLVILPALATAVGLNGAIVLQQLHYWLLKVQAAGDEDHYHKGRWWAYNTYEEWLQNFPFWSIGTVKRTFQRLEEQGLVLSSDAFNKHPMDHTKWYTIDYDALETFLAEKGTGTRAVQNAPLDEGNLPPSNGAECADRSVQNAPIDEHKMYPSSDTECTDRSVQNVPIDERKVHPSNGADCTDRSVQNAPLNLTETTQRLPETSAEIPAAGADAAADPPEPASAPVSEIEPAEPPAEDPPPEPPPAPSTSRPKRKAQNGRARTEQDDMFDAVAWVLYGAKTSEDIAVLSKGARVSTGRAAKRLRDYGAGTGDLREWWGWWCEFDWRGKQRQRPTSSQLTDSWPQFTAWREDPEARASPDGRRVGGRGANDDEYVIEQREDQRIDLRDYVQRES